MQEVSPWSLHDLQRQIAYDRLLQRLYLASEDWILKGAAALLAREIAVRATLDIDLYRHSSLSAAETDLRAAAALDIGDWFRFDFGKREITGDGAGLRLRATATIGATVWSEFHVDLVGPDIQMTGEPDNVRPLVGVNTAELPQRTYWAYPVADHVADKIAAILERHGTQARPSTRYKDLVDLVAIITGVRIAADAQLLALRSEANRRTLRLPARFMVLDRQLWERGYAAEARRSLLREANSLDEALMLVSPFVDALLQGTARGTWEPNERAWQ